MGNRLHSYGTPAHRLERELMRVAAALELELQVLSTPTALILAFGPVAEQHTHILRTDQGDEDLGKLIEFDAVTERVVAGSLSPKQATRELDRIAASPARYGHIGTLFAFAGTAACAARFFGGGLPEVALSGFVGLLLALLAIASSARRDAVGLFEPLAAFLATTLSAAARLLWPEVSAETVALASLIVLIPGLTFTLGMTELATRHLVSGAARLAKAAIVFLSMAMGVMLARRTTEAMLNLSPAVARTAPPSWTEWLALGLAPIGFAVLFRLRLREWAWIYAAGLTGYLVARELGESLGTEIGTMVAAFAVALLSNAYGRITNRPSTVPLLPGILMLVPGSVGFRSLTFFLADDAVSGLQAAFQMSLVAASLVAGLLAANAILRPRREL